VNRETYTVRAKRWQNGWELHISGPDDYEGVSQSHGRRSAASMARDYIALDLEIPPDSFDVKVIPEVGNFLSDLVKDAKTALRIAAEKTAEAAEKSREAAVALHQDGMTQQDIADVLNVTQQRVSQLLSHERPRAKARTTKRKEVRHERRVS
jgi:predicted XRE-type DNA-binding protein